MSPRLLNVYLFFKAAVVSWLLFAFITSVRLHGLTSHVGVFYLVFALWFTFTTFLTLRTARKKASPSEPR